MKKLLVLIFMVICVFCNSALCLAGTIKTEYDVDDNEISHEYEISYRIGTANTTSVTADFTYSKDYRFNKDFDTDTQTCSSRDMVFIMFWDYAYRLRYIKDEMVLTELETGKKTVVPITFTRKKSNKGDCDLLHFVLWPDKNPEIWLLASENKPFQISFNFKVPTTKGIAKNLNFNFDREELDKLRSVIEYDLYSDPSQAENISKAMAAIPAK